MYYIVTGAAGFIGANIVKGLNGRGITDIIAVDNMKKADKFKNLVDCEIADYLDKEDFLDLILDGGPCERGIESTIVSFVGERPVLLRAGALETSVLNEALGGTLAVRGDEDGISAPGQLKSHYAPNARVRLNAEAPEPGEGWLAFGDTPYPGLNLSETGDLREAAKKLFAALRTLDASHDRIAVAPIPNDGLGEAINDRLARAAHRD